MSNANLADSIVRAIVHLNFNEADQARSVLLDVSEINFNQAKGESNVNPAS